jgi:hypothetical protein
MNLSSNPDPTDYSNNTFIYLSPSWPTAHDVYKWLLRHGINNLVSPKDLHVTLCYSDKHIEGFHPDGYEMSPIRIHPRNARFALFGEGHDVLVLLQPQDKLQLLFHCFLK